MSARVLPERPLPGHAVCLDLRTAGAYDPEAVVRAALDAPQPGGERRFLVLDEADRLVSHQLLYERLSSYGPAHIVCLAVGVRGERTVRRTLTLRPPAAGVLWVFDTTEEGVPAEAVLRPLVDVLSTPEVFDAVLRALGEVVHGVAVPAVRVLEHDLTDEARARAWRQAVEGLTGPEVPAGAASAEQVPPALALLLDEGLPRSLADHRWLPAQGRAGLRLATCDDAVQDAVDGYRRVRGAAGLLTGAGRTVDLPGDIERVAGELERFRIAVADAFAAAGGSRLTVEHRGVLRDRGIELPEMPREISRAGIVPALRDHTHELIGKGLPLRSVAARLAALSARTAPVGSASRLARLDAICGPERLRRLGGRHPFTAGGSRPVDFAVTGLLALLAGVWPVLGWVLGPAVGVLAAGLAHLMLRRRPNRSPDGRIDGGGATGAAPRLFGGVLGGLVGAGLGQFLGLPLWAGAVALVLSVAAVVLLALRDWSRAVDDWWARADPEDAWRILREVQGLVVTTAVHDWLFAEVRHHCSAGAGAVARLLRGLADTADAHGRGPAHANGPGYAYVPSAHAVDPGEGGSRNRAAGPPEPDGGSSSWSWEDWGDGGADDVWSDMDEEPPPPVRASAPPANGSPYPADPFGPAGPFGTSVPTDRGPAVAGGGAARGRPDVGPEPVPAWLERRYGDGGPLLVDTLVGDLVAGTLLILDRCWAGIERDPGAVVPAVHEERIAELLDETRVRLERDVAASPPPRYEGLRDQDALSGLAAFTDRSDRPDAARLTGVAPDAVARLVLAEDDPARTVALCGPEHMRLLSHDPVAARQVRFVPEAMRRGAAGDDIWRGTAEDVVWTGAGRHAGILRLVPLRADVVHTVRAEEAGET
ncbi:hypothetical protein PV371_33800 [Streptomyces sp. TX20-6-3]|uniref:hypothetical protein n=1 Tax=Streptomyces sp. TX20-6-3 TaxID=3028705 RepID=UPI0029A4EFD4|nr:hypothetical protein [Streptomyces sp. TX20-6-3]MDX2564601.1 hypothetical protein [Streptomyces sp. TX20-6-3]